VSEWEDESVSVSVTVFGTMSYKLSIYEDKSSSYCFFVFSFKTKSALQIS